jgi:hypothetical protein
MRKGLATAGIAVSVACLIAAAVMAAPLGAFAGGQPPRERACKNNSEQVAPCFTIHGRLNYWEGNPSARIWRVGTHRILGVSDAHADVQQMPPGLEKKLAWDIFIFGDFEVCPFTKEEPGVMQFVCIASASHLVVVDKRDK